jgi:hypothetical protein
MSSRDWSNLAETLYQSTPPPFDHLVRLHHIVFPVQGPHPQSVQLVVFEDTNTIPDVLRSRPTNFQHRHHRGADNITDGHTNSSPYGIAHIGNNASHADGTDSRGDVSNDDQRGEDLVEYTAQDAAAAGDGEEPDRTKEAVVIQRAARRHLLKHVEESSNDALIIGRQRLFKFCKASANDVHVKYRKIYLGPIPHLLLCLEWIANRAQESKNAIKGRRAEATLQELSELIVEHKEIR